jgi:hypothetical protein
LFVTTTTAAAAAAAADDDQNYDNTFNFDIFIYLSFFEDCTEDDTTRTTKAVYEMLLPALENLNKRLDVLTYDRDILMYSERSS